MRRNPFHWLSSGGGALAVLVPNCPACAAASGTILSALGLSASAAASATRWLVPFFLAAGLAGLWVGARRHHAWWIPGLGVVGAVLLYAGWWAQYELAVFVGVATVFVASVLNLRRQRRQPATLRLRKESQS
ncbi:MAG: MerC domain-containing protein [Thermoanaerobaculia bacterium]